LLAGQTKAAPVEGEVAAATDELAAIEAEDREASAGKPASGEPAEALDVTSPAAPAKVEDVRAVDRDLDELVPAFRERLERVVERMESEFGHKVTIVEAHRSQERQNYLFEQGRSRPGQVVTWTRNSNHLTG